MKTEQATHDAIGQVLTSKDARGNITTYSYDAAGRRLNVTDANSKVTAFVYDANGSQTSMTDALSHTMSYQYDVLNRRTKTIFHDATFSTAAYDALGRTTSKTDQAGKTMSYEYDSLSRLVKVTDALNQNTTYAYDEIGNQLTQTDALNRTTSYEYDKLGRRTKRKLPGNQVETYNYNITGTLVNRVDFNGKTTTFAYDNQNRLLSKTPDASFAQAPISYSYNLLGQRLTMNDASGTTNYGYDVRNRLLSKQTPNGTLSYTYNGASSLATVRSSNVNGVSVDYSYDVLNRLSSVIDNNQPASNQATNYSYDDVGNLSNYTTGNGVQTSYTYNNLNRLTNVASTKAATTIASYAYTLGNAGNRTAVTEASGRTVNYSYDNLYRLTNETIANATGTNPNGAISYTYDAVGNRLSRTSSVAGVSTVASQSVDANDRLSTDNYDNNGNTTGSSGNGYVYDFENRLVKVNAGTANEISLVYDGDGNRVSKTVGGIATKFLVDTNNLTGYAQVVEELQGGSVVRQYSYGHDLVSQRQFIAGNWTTNFYQYDGHGSVRGLTDSTGGLTDTFTYDAFGVLINRTGTTPNLYLYAGEQYDPDLGLYYNRARYLNTGTGRFWSMDSYEGSSKDPASLHKYLYASNNSTNRIDPSGNFSLSEISATINIYTNMAVLWASQYKTAIAIGQFLFAALNIASFFSDPDYRDFIITTNGATAASKMLADDAVFVFRLGRGIFGGISVVTSAANKLLRGSGPVAGVIEVSPRTQSTRVLQSYYPKNGIEFIFDPQTNTFAVGKPSSATGITGSPHQKLATSINANDSSVVGGIFTRGENGEIITNEMSGHYGINWTDAIRKQFVQFLEEETGLIVNHLSWS